MGYNRRALISSDRRTLGEMRDLTTERMKANLSLFQAGSGKSRGLLATERYASFDYCYNHFQSYRETKGLAALLEKEHLELSCLHLAFYLASWGMLRGSAELLQKSVRHYVPLIQVIAETPLAVWAIDIHRYNDENIDSLLDLDRRIREAVRGERPASDTLSTKIMLGVFGNVPAFDSYFRAGSGISTFGQHSLKQIGTFYQAHSEVFDREIMTLDFHSGEPTPRFYPRAKLMDMIFFIEGIGNPAQSGSAG